MVVMILAESLSKIQMLAGISPAVLAQWQDALGKFARGWIEAHGYFGLFFLLFASGLGLPLPEDVPLVFAGVLIYRGMMSWAVAAPVAWLALMCGDSALYILGYVLGRRVVHLPILGRHISEKRLIRCEGWFARWGIWAVGIGRMFAGIRTAIVLTAGTMRFNYLKLLAADGIAAIFSGGAFMILGFWAAQHARPLGPLIEKYRLLFMAVGVTASLLLIAVLWYRSRRRAREAAVKTADKVSAGLA
jgi:membrane protein DedA with SNARE-associated domain